ncbi:MAG: HD domain-containing protein [Desulfomonilaceae bacterium]
MNTPGEQECVALLEKYSTPEHIILHSRKVWEVGKLVGEGLLRRNHPVDLPLIRASCLLHDIGKYPCILDGTRYHDIRGKQILETEGLSSIADIVVQHVILRSEIEGPVKEEHVVHYADKRVVHDEVVSLEERFLYLNRTYGKSPQALERLMMMKQDTHRLEEAIFILLDFGPEDVVALLR